MGNEGFFIKDVKHTLFNKEISNATTKYYYKPSNNSDKKYTITLYLNKDSIEFRYSGYLESSDPNTNKSPYFRPDDKIFTLHLKSDSFSGLDIEEEIKMLFSGSFPILKELQLTKDIKNEPLPNNFKNSFQINRNNIIDTKDRKRIFFKELFLDFIFDVKYNPDIFKDDPNFKNIKPLLLRSKIIQTILVKAEFYYKFEKLETPSYINQIQNNLLITDLKLAMKNWIELLQEPHINKTVNEKYKWFEDVETEMANALRFQINNINRVDKNIIKEVTKESFHLREHTTSWFINRNNILKAWNNNGWFEKGVFFGALVLISILIYKIYDSIYNNWFYHDINSFDLINNKYLGISIIYFIPLFPVLLGVIWLVLKFIFYKSISVFNMELILSKLLGLFKYYMFPLWALIFGATHIVFSTGSFYNRIFIKNLWTQELGTLFIFFLGTIVFFKGIISLKDWFSRKLKILIPFWIDLFFFTFLLIVILCYFKNEFYVNSMVLYCLIVVTLIGVLYNHEKESHPKLAPKTSFNKTLSMLFYGLIISFIVNVFYINTEYKEYLERYEYLGHIWHHTQKEYAFSDKDNDGYYNFSEVNENYAGEYDVVINDTLKLIKLYSTSKITKDKDYYSYFYVYKPSDTLYISKKEDLQKNDSITLSKYKKNRILLLEKKKEELENQTSIIENKPDSLKSLFIEEIKNSKIKLKNIIKVLETESDSIKKDSIHLEKQTQKELDKSFYKGYTKVKKSIYQPLSHDIEVTIDKHFFNELQSIYLYKGKNYNKSTKSYDNYVRSKVPVIKEVNLFGIKIKTIPNILFINTFLSLFIAVILQIFINKTKFLKGGSGHGH